MGRSPERNRCLNSVRLAVVAEKTVKAQFDLVAVDLSLGEGGYFHGGEIRMLNPSVFWFFLDRIDNLVGRIVRVHRLQTRPRNQTLHHLIDN